MDWLAPTESQPYISFSDHANCYKNKSVFMPVTYGYNYDDFSDADPERFRFARDTSFGRRHLSFWSKSTITLWIVSTGQDILQFLPTMCIRSRKLAQLQVHGVISMVFVKVNKI